MEEAEVSRLILSLVRSMNRTLDEWIARYNKKVPEGFKRDERFALFYLPDKGFCELGLTEHTVLIWQASGDGRHWKNFAENVARKFGKEVCVTTCERKEVRAWIKLFGFKVTKTEERDGFKRYHGVGENGAWGVMTEVEIDGRRRAYQVTWEVT